MRAFEAEAQQLIATVHGVGYRLTAPVKVLAHPSPAPVLRLDLHPGDHPPQRPLWKLEQPLGAGGFGQVWLARHEKTGEARLFKFAADGPALSALKREITLYRLLRETLGEREDLTRVLDWNLAEPPFFLEAEFVAGGSLSDWAAQAGGLAGRPLDIRLELIARISDALAAAHAVGVLHKDLKPANVLVRAADGESPRIKLTDFGSGRVLEPERLRALGITRLGFTQTIEADRSTSGTLAYLAPELLSGQPLSVQADIYALGVMLYQIVIGDFSHPLAPGWEREVSDELLREDIALCCDGNPQRRLADAAELARRLRALTPRRAERSAQLQAQERAQADARRLERLQARRGALIAAVVVLALGLAATLTLYARLREQQAETRAQAQRAFDQTEIAQAVVAFLREDLLAAANPENTGRRDVPVREVVDKAAARAAERFAEAPALRASIAHTLGVVYRGLGDYPAARTQLDQAIAAGDTLAANEARLLLAEILHADVGDPPAAQAQLAPLLQTTLHGAPTELAEQILAAQALQATIKAEGPGVAAALAEFDALLPRIAATLGPDHPLLHQAGYWRAAALMEAGRAQEAVTAYRQALADYEARPGVQAASTLELRLNLVEALMAAEQLSEALSEAQQARQQALALYGPDHAMSLFSASVLARAQELSGNLPAAEALLREAVERNVKLFGEAHRDTAVYRSNLSNVYVAQGRHAEALALLNAIHRQRVAELGAGHPKTITTAFKVARCLQDLKRWPQAETLLRSLQTPAKKAFPGSHPMPGQITLALADTLAQSGRRPEARTLFDQAVAQLETSVGADHPLSRKARELRTAAR